MKRAFNIYRSETLFSLFLLLFLSSCSKPLYKAKDDNNQILYFSEAKIKKTPLMPSGWLLPTFAGVFAFASTKKVTVFNSTTKVYEPIPLPIRAGIGVGISGLTIGGSHLFTFGKNNVLTTTNVVTEKNVDQWWDLVQKKKRYKDYLLVKHNNGKYLKNNEIIAVEKTEYPYLAKRIIEKENEYDNARYSSSKSWSLSDYLIAGLAAYVGVKTVHAIISPSSSDNDTKNTPSGSGKVTKDYNCSGYYECTKFTCDNNGKTASIKRKQENSKYEISFHENHETATTHKDALYIAKRLTNCY